MTKVKRIQVPLKDEIISELKAGDMVSLTGTLYTGRDAAHKRMVETLQKGKELPFPLQGQVIYYVGPCPAKPGQALGSCGPTTSGRMDAYAPTLMTQGLKGMIGKGPRSAAVIEAMKQHKAVYLAAVGGAAALIAQAVKKAEVIAYPDLGPEAIYCLQVEDFPCVVAVDSEGRDLYQIGPEQYKKQR